MLSEEVNDTTASLIVAQLLYLEAQDPDKDIQFYINSPGGSVSAGMAIYDTMQYVKPDVSTICVGLAASMGDLGFSFGDEDADACMEYLCGMDEMKAAGDAAAPRLREALKLVFC